MPVAGSCQCSIVSVDRQLTQNFSGLFHRCPAHLPQLKLMFLRGKWASDNQDNWVQEVVREFQSVLSVPSFNDGIGRE